MKFFLTVSLAFLSCSVHAQWSHSYPPVAGYDHQIYLEGYELPTLNAGAMDPAPSPDGSEVAFASRGWIWVLDLESSVARRATDSGGLDARPEWSPDASSLVFMRDHDSHFSIVRLDLDSGDEQVLIDEKVINLDPVFSPDGGHVYYASAENGPFELWRVSLATLERTPVSESAQVGRRTTKRRPQLLDPDSLIVYLYKQNYYDAIRLLNTRTGAETTLVEAWITPQSDLSLSPDGRHLAYTWTNEDAGNDLRLLSLEDTSTSVLLTRGNGLPMAPQFSHDGQWVYFSEADENERIGIRRINVAGGPVESVDIAEWDWGAPTGTITISTLIDGEPGPARISVQDASGHPVIPEGGLIHREGQHKRVFFYTDGEITLTAPAGPVTVTAVHGIETPVATGEGQVRRNRDSEVTVDLERVWDPSEERWYAGDNHFHLNYGGPYQLAPEDIIPELRGEAMDFAYPLIANLQNRFFESGLIDWRFSDGPIIEFGQEVRAHYLGHVNLLGIDEPFWPWVWGPLYQVYGDDDRLNSTALRFAREQGGLGGYVHPISAEDPFAEENLGSAPGAFVADAVLGEVDIIELACLWSDEIGTAALWHAVLNLGIPLAASAGSDAMNNLYRTMATGATRVYVKPEGGLTTASYLEALKNGRSFTSNGPLLNFNVAGVGPGGVIKAPGDTVEFTLAVHSAQPFDNVQLFVNGTVVETLDGSLEPGSKRYSGSVDVPEGGWVTARVLGENSGWPALDAYLYAETSPVWFFAVGSTEPAARSQAAVDLLRVLDASESGLKAGYGTTPIPRIREHFGKARSQLESWVAE